MKIKEVLRGRDDGIIRRVRRKKFKRRFSWMKFSDLRVRI